MKEMLNNINGKKVGNGAIKILFILILNIPLGVYLIGDIVPYARIGEFKLSGIDYLRLSDKVEGYQIGLLYFFIGVGIVLTVLFIKWGIQATKQEKEKQEARDNQEKQTKAIVEAINNNKKEEKDIEKYL